VSRVDIPLTLWESSLRWLILYLINSTNSSVKVPGLRTRVSIQSQCKCKSMFMKHNAKATHFQQQPCPKSVLECRSTRLAARCAASGARTTTKRASLSARRCSFFVLGQSPLLASSDAWEAAHQPSTHASPADRCSRRTLRRSRRSTVSRACRGLCAEGGESASALFFKLTRGDALCW
jgi:hypothetical protein